MVELNFTKSKDGLIPAIAQDYRTGTVLMLAYINSEAWEKTLQTGRAHYWSRSRSQIWLKGENSGNLQEIREILVDCDEDCVIYKVEQKGGAACHNGYPSCFYRKVDEKGLTIIANRVIDPKDVYS